MSPLTDENIIRIWETGYRQHPLDRALTILVIYEPGITREQLAGLPIASRDDRLLEVREQGFGTQIEALLQCPQCSEELEFSLSTKELRSRVNKQSLAYGGSENPLEISVDDMTIRLRLPDSRDLAAVVGYDHIQTARREIVKRCIIGVGSNGKSNASDGYPPGAIRAAEIKIAECQKQSEILLDIQCSSCGSKGQLMFDIVSFLWQEISMRAKKLLNDIHLLASAYGWTEADVLALSPGRRQFYLEAVS